MIKKLTSHIDNDEYTQYVYDAFDIQNREENVETISFDLSEIDNFDWNIGIIYGSSGSGKTTILKEIGELSKINFDYDKPLISNFDWLSPKEATMLLTGMGLSSVPTWLRPFRLLSNGEQYRAELAYKVGKGDGVILIDEFTSVVNRDVAKAMSFSLQKYVRRSGKKIILASVHYDIFEWLMPDWTLSPEKGGALERGGWLRQSRPKIELSVSRTEVGAWDLFKKHHYLTANVNKAFGFLLFEWGEKPVGMCVYKTQPTGAVPNAYGLSRTVVLPDFQGLGIGKAISEFTAGILVAAGKRVFTKTVNPALGLYREESIDFRPTSKNGKLRKDNKSDNAAIRRLTRISYCHEYTGMGIEGYNDLLLPLKQIREISDLW